MKYYSLRVSCFTWAGQSVVFLMMVCLESIENMKCANMEKLFLTSKNLVVLSFLQNFSFPPNCAGLFVIISEP